MGIDKFDQLEWWETQKYIYKYQLLGLAYGAINNKKLSEQKEIEDNLNICCQEIKKIRDSFNVLEKALYNK